MRVLAAAVLFPLVMACGADEKEGDSTTTAPLELVADLDDLLVGYEGWAQVDAGIVGSTAGHGDFVENWLNQTALDTVNAAAGGDMPDGAILVKQGYNDAAGTDKKNLTVMWKTEGEWFWAQYNSDGENKAAGFTGDDPVASCVGCHEADADQQDLVVTYDW